MMISFDNSHNSSDSKPNRNLLGKPLIPCSTEPLTGFFRDGFCRTCSDDTGSHTVCAVMTEAFLRFTVEAGNDLVTPDQNSISLVLYQVIDGAFVQHDGSKR